MNPYTLLGVGALWVASVAAAGWWAYGAGQDAESAAQAREERAAVIGAQAAASAAAAAISRIEVRNVTVNKALEREVLTREVFRDCRSGAAAMQLLNATPGIAAGAASAPGDGELPASGAAR
jgi:hypothetical protein